MAANKRTETQREYDLELTASLYLRGNSQQSIAERIGVTREQIKYDLKAIQKRWQDKTTINLDAAKQKELARIDELEREYWQAWDASKGEKTKQRQESNGKDSEGKPRIIKAVMEKDQMLGNPAFLAGVQWCISERCKLLGIYAPAKQEMSGPNGGPIETKDITLDDTERASRIAALLDKARARRDGQVASQEVS